MFELFKKYYLRKYYAFIVLFMLAVIAVMIHTSCANIIPPTGGPRDSLPPVLLKSVPADSTLNFNAKKITLSFDEYVQLDNKIQSDLIVSPNPNQMPYVTSHLRDVTIRLKDSLKPNTTYSIDFGNSLKDINEGNPYRNFTYVFSTGNSIATGGLSGKVQLAETGTADSTLIAILHTNLNDSAVKKLKPDYYTRLDSGGNFHFRFIENGIYNVFVLPNDYTKKYDDSSKMFAFLNEPVTINDAPAAPVMLYAYNEYPPGKEGSSFNNAPAPNTSSKKKDADTVKTIKFATTLDNREQDLLSDLVISFAEHLEHFDSSKINLTDTNYHPVAAYKIVADTSFANFSLQYPWKEDQYFKLVVQKDAFIDSAGKMLAKNDTLSFKTSSESQYGSVRLRFSGIDFNQNPVLQFIQNNKVVDSVSLTQTEFYRKLYKPGEYDMRILFDTDKNMTWTPGNYELKRQPEISIRIPRKLTIKQNWDNEVNVNL